MKPPRITRLFRFGLGTMLVIVTVLCVWLGLKVDRANKQKEAVDAWAFHGAILPLPDFPGQTNTEATRSLSLPHDPPIILAGQLVEAAITQPGNVRPHVHR